MPMDVFKARIILTRAILSMLEAMLTANVDAVKKLSSLRPSASDYRLIWRSPVVHILSTNQNNGPDLNLDLRWAQVLV